MRSTLDMGMVKLPAPMSTSTEVSVCLTIRPCSLPPLLRNTTSARDEEGAPITRARKRIKNELFFISNYLPNLATKPTRRQDAVSGEVSLTGVLPPSASASGSPPSSSG